MSGKASERIKNRRLRNSRIGPGEPEHHVDGGRFARAVGSEEGDGLARVNGDGHAPNGFDVAVGLGEVGEENSALAGVARDHLSTLDSSCHEKRTRRRRPRQLTFA